MQATPRSRQKRTVQEVPFNGMIVRHTPFEAWSPVLTGPCQPEVAETSRVFGTADGNRATHGTATELTVTDATPEATPAPLSMRDVTQTAVADIFKTDGSNSVLKPEGHTCQNGAEPLWFNHYTGGRQ